MSTKKTPYETIELMWESYRSHVLGDGCPDILYTECRNAFYAGFHSLMAVIVAIGDGVIDEKAGAEYLEELRQQLQTFIRGKQREH